MSSEYQCQLPFVAQPPNNNNLFTFSARGSGNGRLRVQFGTGDTNLSSPSSDGSVNPGNPDSSMHQSSFAAFNQGTLPNRSRRHTRQNETSPCPPPPSERRMGVYFPSLDLAAVNIGLIGSPTIAPVNTPDPSNTPSAHTPSGQTLPTIDEALERLPAFSSLPPSDEMSETTTLADIIEPLEDDDRMQLSSSPPAANRTSTPFSHSGVREHSDWQEDIEGDLDRALARLTNLAHDEYEKDPSISAEEYYTSRLDAAIHRQSMRYTILCQAWSDCSGALIQRNKLRNVLNDVLQKKPGAEQKAEEELNKLDNEE